MLLMIASISAAVAAILIALGGLHVFWAAGGSVGAGAVIPESAGRPLFRPGRLATLAVAFALFAAAAVVICRVWLLTDNGFVRLGNWVLGLVFGLRAIGDFRWVGFFKRHRGTRFARWDDRLYSPLCLLLAAGCAV